MSTRGLYTFTDADNSWNVYRHMDNYPSGAAEAIALALTKAWKLPRFEADEFATSFIAANKTEGGNLRMMPQGKPSDVAQKNCSDIEYRYEITAPKGKLHVKAFEVNAWDVYREKQICSGSLEKFQAWAKDHN